MKKKTHTTRTRTVNMDDPQLDAVYAQIRKDLKKYGLAETQRRQQEAMEAFLNSIK
jgi:hypothetical protein